MNPFEQTLLLVSSALITATALVVLIVQMVRHRRDGGD